MALGHYVNAFLTMTRKDSDLANKVGNFLPYCSVLVCKLESKFDRSEKFWDFYGSSLQVKPSVPSPTARSPFAVRYCENVFQREARTELQRRNDQKFTLSSRETSVLRFAAAIIAGANVTWGVWSAKQNCIKVSFSANVSLRIKKITCRKNSITNKIALSHGRE